MDFDVVVIGGGSAGYAAADTAQREGARVAIVDPGPLGGLCILRGCMPTKTLLRSSDVMALLRRAREFGLEPVTARAHLEAIVERKDRLIEEFTRYRVEQLRDPRFTLIEAAASFTSPREIQAGGRLIRASAFIIATGSVIQHDFPVPGLAETPCLTSDDVIHLKEQPESMIVLGGGPVAVELAQFFQRIGTRVTLIQRSGHILSSGDEDLARPVEARFREEGMQVFTGTRLLRVEQRGGKKSVTFLQGEQEHRVEADSLLQALGRRPNTGGLGLSPARVALGESGITVDTALRTSQPHIFAVGDVTGGLEVVHVAVQQGEIAGYNAVHPQNPRHYDDRLKTLVVFTDPQVAGVGLSEKECRAGNIPYRAASYPFSDHGKSLVLGETHGLVKLLADPETGRVIGGHITGPEAGELIHQLITLMHFRGTVSDLLKMPHYHPTLSEILTYPAETLQASL